MDMGEGSGDQQLLTPSDMSEDEGTGVRHRGFSQSPLRPDPAENTYEVVKARFERKCFMIHSPFLYGVVHEDDSMEPSFLKHNELKQYFCNWVYFEPCKVDEQNPSGWKSMRFVDTWLMDLNRREVSRVVVDPRNTESGVYNLWKPLIASQLKHIEPAARYEDVLSPIIHHLHHVVTEQNDLHTNWLLDWMANMVQRPYQRSQVAILLYGKQGCGKGIIIDWMRKAVMGPACSYQTADPENDILGRFANGLTNKILVQIDEVKSLVNHADALKNIITNSTLRHEKKGKDIIVVDNLANLIFTSNNENALAVPSDDRRFVFFRCSSVYKGDKGYFDRLGAFLEMPGVDRLFYQFLMQRDLSRYRYDFQSTRPITAYYREAQVGSISVINRFLSAQVNSMDMLPCETFAARFYDRYTQFCTNGGYRYPLNCNNFGKEIKRVRGIRVKRQRSGMVYTLDKPEIKNYLCSLNEYDEDAEFLS